MKLSLCLDLLYLEIGPTGPVFADTEKLLAGMDLAKKTGIDTVEFWDWYGRDWKRLLEKKKELGLSVSAICSKNRGNLDDPSKLKEALAGLKETLEVAVQFDCPNVIVTAGGNSAVDHEEHKKAIIAGLKEMAPLAEKAGVTLILEPISGEYFTDSQEAFDIIREVESPRVRLLYDIFHFQCMEGNIIRTITENIGKIGHFHAASVPGRNEITGGELNYPAVIRAIQESGYQGYFGLEYLPMTGKEESVRACKKLFENSL